MLIILAYSSRHDYGIIVYIDLLVENSGQYQNLNYCYYKIFPSWYKSDNIITINFFRGDRTGCCIRDHAGCTSCSEWSVHNMVL